MLKALENISAHYANPTRFMALAAKWHAPLWGLAALCLAYGLYRVAYVPDDYQQGATVKIMFVHVPAAWMALFGYSFIFFASVTALVFRHPLGHVAARAAAPVGAVFTLIALVTGSLWGQPMWGTWWVWDARLTSVWSCFSSISAISRYGRRLMSRRARTRGVLIGDCRFYQCADCQILCRLVEHVAPAGQRVALGAARFACRFSLSAFDYGARLFAVVFGAHPDPHANGNFAAKLRRRS